MQRAAVVIAVVDESETLAEVLAQVGRLRLQAVVVVNGPSGKPAQVARGAGAHVIRFEEQVGHDVGRAIGAAHLAEAEAILFLDADLVIPADDLLPFLTAVATGVDVALNRLDRYIPPGARLHPVNAAKRFLTSVLGRPDLGCASLTAIPHALSHRAVDCLGSRSLAVPPLALAQAVRTGLSVSAVHAVDVVSSNVRRPGLNLGPSNPVEQLILGDHLEALDWLCHHHGDPRGTLSDLGRRRELLVP